MRKRESLHDPRQTPDSQRFLSRSAHVQDIHKRTMSNPEGTQAEYVPLLAMEDAGGAGAGDGDEHEGFVISSKNASNINAGSPKLTLVTNASVWAALAISFLAFLASFTGLLYVLRPGGTMNMLDVGVLRHPSLYLGLERVPEIRARLAAQRLLEKLKPTPPGTHDGGHGDSSAQGAQDSQNMGSGGENTFRLVHPTRARRVNSLFPDEVMRNDGWVLVSNSDSTLLEFVLPTNNMTSQARSCTLVTAFPGRRALGSRLLTIEGAPEIRLYQISDSNLRGALTWNNKSTSRRQLESVRINFGTAVDNRAFNCSAGSSVVLELECSEASKQTDNGCRVEYALGDSSSEFGLNMLISGTQAG